MTTAVFSHTVCHLGEGAFWHPERKQFFWFDILGKRLLTRVADKEQSWQFGTCVSAAAWVDHDTLLIACADALLRFDIKTGSSEKLIDLEAQNPLIRSNDGRADPYGGFWIGTMGYNAEPGAGAIYRYYRGELRALYTKLTIPNAICFTPDGGHAYFTDTADGRVMRQRLGHDGWPIGDPDIYLDLRDQAFGSDGAVVDADGYFWNAQWGAARVACYDPTGALMITQPLPTPQTSCPAFGGADLSTLYVTTAAQGLNDDKMAGKTFALRTTTQGQAEHQILL